ncbi:MAG: DnaB-like helicase C-terminal domain-containing protein [Nostoc sp.]|uniref:DnaB-like helicase C-terminal domain-containing protein n=1 Tax=Nostoc sp. TaxID=1180 RepID=UPI002FFAE53C
MLEHDSSLELIVIDYIQLSTENNDENRARELAKITRSLKGLAKELNCNKKPSIIEHLGC